MLFIPRHEITCQFGMKKEQSNIILITLADVKKKKKGNTSLPIFLFGWLVWDSVKTSHRKKESVYYPGFVTLKPNRCHVWVCQFNTFILDITAPMDVWAANKWQMNHRWTPEKKKIFSCHTISHAIYCHTAIICEGPNKFSEDTKQRVNFFAYICVCNGNGKASYFNKIIIIKKHSL